MSISNDDDSVAVKPSDGRSPYGCTRNILVERCVFTGFGASVGSVPPHADVNCVRNVTFRSISMPGTGKGIYVKSNPTCGFETDRFGRRVAKTAVISDVTYEHVSMVRPWWWAVWIGPQQQHEPGSALGHKCALTYNLIGVSNHMGSLGGGHYTADCASSRDKWHNFNDARVSETAVSKLGGASPYLLFYEQT